MGRVKGRSSITYKHKLERIKKWHTKREKDHALAIKEGKKVKDLKSLEFYVEKLKQPNGEKKSSGASSISRPEKGKAGWW